MLDLEGTLGDHTHVWREIEEAFGVDRERARERFRNYQRGDRGWQEFNHKRIREWNRNTQDRNAQDVYMEAIERHLQEHGIRPQARDLVRKFHSQGFETFLASHAPDRYSRRALKKTGVQNHVDTVEISFTGNGRKIDGINRKESHCKADFVRSLQEQGYEVWFLGNGRNDVEAAESADRSFMVENVEELDYTDFGCHVFTGGIEEVVEKAGKSFQRVKR